MVAMAAERDLTVPEVAEAMRVSEWTVRQWLRQGRLRGYQPGGKRAGWRVRPSEIERFKRQAEAREEA